MARLYDKAYCSIDHFKDKKCKHNDHAIYDAKFVYERPIKFQPVCIRCGLVGMWARIEVIPARLEKVIKALGDQKRGAR